jgi:hypothetical protein
MATLPRAVQRQVEAAEALLTGADQPAETQTAVLETPPEPQQEPTAQVAAPAPEPSPAQVQQPKDDWQQKYQILQGKYNAEVPQLHHQVKDLTRKLSETADRMEQIAKSQETKPAEQRQNADPKDVENFGSDLVDMVQRVAQQMLGGVAAKVEGVAIDLEKRIAQLEQVVKGTSQAVNVTAEELFFNKLTTQVPDWEAVNADERFLAWLGEVDPMLGQPRQAALDAAQQNLNVARTVSIFNMFKATLPQKPTKANTSVEKQISPSSVATPAMTPTEKPVLTQAQSSQFYADVARGKYRGRDSEAAKLEQIINLAIAEGRVR